MGMVGKKKKRTYYAVVTCKQIGAICRYIHGTLICAHLYSQCTSMQCLLRFGPLGSLLVLKLFTLSLQAREHTHSVFIKLVTILKLACVSVLGREKMSCKLAGLITFGYIQSKQSNKQEKNIYICYFSLLLLLFSLPQVEYT